MPLFKSRGNSRYVSCPLYQSSDGRKTEQTSAATASADDDDMTGSNAELFSEYRKQKDRIKEQLEMQEKRREDLQKQLLDLDQK